MNTIPGEMVRSKLLPIFISVLAVSLSAMLMPATHGKDVGEPAGTGESADTGGISGARRPDLELPAEARVSERVFGLKGISNVGRVAPHIYRGAQPDAEGYATLKEMGIRTVINLRSRHSEKEAVKAVGMKSLEFPISTYKKLEAETVEKVIAEMTNPENQPVYLHCHYGKDRTGVIVALYRIEIDGWSLEDAEEEMQTFGFNDIWFNLKRFLREYGEEREAKGGQGSREMPRKEDDPQ